MSYFNIVAQTSENTVVTEYEPVKARSESYQSEAELEREFIRMLTEQGYEYLTIHTENDLIANLRKQIEKLNGYSFSDSEWKRFFSDCIANPNLAAAVFENLGAAPSGGGVTARLTDAAGKTLSEVALAPGVRRVAFFGAIPFSEGMGLDLGDASATSARLMFRMPEQ